MPKYKVLGMIEHSYVIYVPADEKNPPKTMKSFGHGQNVPVDASGEIELSEDEAKRLTGRVELLKPAPVVPSPKSKKDK